MSSRRHSFWTALVGRAHAAGLKLPDRLVSTTPLPGMNGPSSVAAEGCGLRLPFRSLSVRSSLLNAERREFGQKRIFAHRTFIFDTAIGVFHPRGTKHLDRPL